ncbi:MAG TPA: SurA N-terminal domain-containing protein [Chitinophagales bacterium]|nr:SurA N-terminal domain-containing protein [Chitinophagales bacterium]
MAVIMKIRNKLGLLIVGLIMLAIFAFLLQDAINSNSSVLRFNSNTAGVINGKSVSIQDFDRKVQQAIENYRLANNTANIDDATIWQLRSQTWEQYVNDLLMGEKYAKLGLGIRDDTSALRVKITRDEIEDMIFGSNPHPAVIQSFSDPKTGQYDPSQVSYFLSQLDKDQTGETRQRWLTFEKYLKEDRLRQKFFALVKKGMYTPAWQAAENYTLTNAKVDFDFVYLPYADIPDGDVAVEESELKAYLKSHANKYRQEEETRAIEFVSFDIKPTKEDTLRVKSKLEELYENFKNTSSDSAFLRSYSQKPFDPKYYSRDELTSSIKDTFFSIDTNAVIGPYLEDGYWMYAKLLDRKLIPDSVRAKHIFVSIAGVQNQEGVNEKRAFADSLLKEIKEKGADFNVFVQQYSNDEETKAAGGDMGWIKPGQKYPTIDRALFYKHAQGDIFMVPSDEENKRGFHIIQITEAKPVKDAVQVAFLAKQITASVESERALYAKASQFASAHQTLQAFREGAKELSLREAAGIRKNDNIIANVDDEPAREVVKWVFSAAENQVSGVFSLPDKYVVAALTKVTPEGVTPLDDIRTEIELEVKKQKKAGMLQEKIKGQTDLNVIASSTGKTVQKATGMSFTSTFITGIGQEMGVVGKALAMNEGETSAPLAGDNGVFVIKVTSKQVPELPSDFTAQKRQSEIAAASTVEFSLPPAIRKAADIRDERYKFY